MKRRKRTNSNVPAKGRLRDMADALWSLAVRHHWDHRCAVCGKRKCEAHHLVPRQHEATRYELRNGIALCPTCHKFNATYSPHQNAAGWVCWLRDNHREIFVWYMNNIRPKFDGTKNSAYYCEIIRELREYVDEADFERICGKKFAEYVLTYDAGKR